MDGGAKTKIDPFGALLCLPFPPSFFFSLFFCLCFSQPCCILCMSNHQPFAEPDKKPQKRVKALACYGGGLARGTHHTVSVTHSLTQPFTLLSNSSFKNSCHCQPTFLSTATAAVLSIEKEESIDTGLEQDGGGGAPIAQRDQFANFSRFCFFPGPSRKS